MSVGQQRNESQVGRKQHKQRKMLDTLKVYSNELFFISTNERLMYKFYKTYNYFIFK